MLNNFSAFVFFPWRKVFEDAKLCRCGVRCGKELKVSSLESLLLMWVMTVHRLSCHCVGMAGDVIEVFWVL